MNNKMMPLTIVYGQNPLNQKCLTMEKGPSFSLLVILKKINQEALSYTVYACLIYNCYRWEKVCLCV
jgi:hypothetical protein